MPDTGGATVNNINNITALRGPMEEPSFQDGVPEALECWASSAGPYILILKVEIMAPSPIFSYCC